MGTRIDKNRITPAHAGKSRHFLRLGIENEDHPRTCGEKFRRSIPDVAGSGSPPHMRGKVAAWPTRLPRSRITPAHAGKRHLDL